MSRTPARPRRVPPSSPDRSWSSQSQETPGLPCDPPVRHARIMNANGIDVFLPRLSIIAAWEAPPAGAAHRAA